MKTYICKKCISFGGKAPCTLTCEDDMKPTHCPHDDSKYPNSLWEWVASQSGVEADAESWDDLEEQFSPYEWIPGGIDK